MISENVYDLMFASLEIFPNMTLSSFHRVGSGFCDRVSVLVECFPSWNSIFKSKQPRVSAHQEFWWVN